MKNLSYDELIKFHGHSCPGLAIGYQAVKLAYKYGFNKSEDEEVVAIVENNSCSVDAIQYFFSCTFGKGNLIFNDYGKQVFTIIKRNSKDAIRISLKPINREKLTREEFFSYIMNSDPEKIFNVKRFKVSEDELPKPARIHNSVICENCHEPVMETKIRLLNSRKLCIPCFEKLIQ